MRKFVLVSLLLFAVATIISGCDLKRFGDDASGAAAATAAAGKTLPVPYGLYFTIISEALALTSAVALGIHKWRLSLKLKKAINAHASIVDEARYSVSEKLSSSTEEVIQFIRMRTAATNPGLKEDIQTFSKVRNGIL